MSQPFDRLSKDDSRALRQYIGNFVSHYVVNNGKATVEELNGMDRQELARTWYHHETNHSVWQQRRFESIVDIFYGEFADFYDDVARYIDDRIPRAYMKYHGEDPGKPPDSYTVVCDEKGNLPFGLIYHFSENMIPYDFVPEATPRQVKYLESLAWKNNHYFYQEGITKEEASECIDYFLNMDFKIEPKCFKKYFKPTM